MVQLRYNPNRKCPDCDSINWQLRQDNSPDHLLWKCFDCGISFKETDDGFIKSE